MNATIPEITKPTASCDQFSLAASWRAFSSSYAVAANIVGIPTRNANSVAAGRSVIPASMAAKIVAAERDVPGKTAARIWHRPTQIATDQVSWSDFGLGATYVSMTRMATPPTSNATATGTTVSGSLNPILVAATPSPNVISTDTVSLYR